MRVLRIAVAAALCLTVALVIRRDIVTRYQCSAEKKRTQLWMDSARQSETLDGRMAVARGAIPRLMRCVESDPSDYEALFLLGVAHSEAGQKEAAMRSFEAALALNERPEIYASMGILQLEAGRPEEGRSNLLHAAYFNFYMMADLVAPPFNRELYNAAEARRQRLAAEKGGE